MIVFYFSHLAFSDIGHEFRYWFKWQSSNGCKVLSSSEAREKYTFLLIQHLEDQIDFITPLVLHVANITCKLIRSIRQLLDQIRQLLDQI